MKAKQLRRRGASLDKKKAKAGWWFILPFLVGFVTVYLPMIIGSVRASMMSSTGQNQKFVGFANYVSVLTDRGCQLHKDLGQRYSAIGF